MAAPSPGGPVEAWVPAQVAEWLTGTLHLPSEVGDAFTVNAVAGADLTTLSDEDLTVHLGLTPLQARKVRTALTALGVAEPRTPTPAAAAPPPAPAAPAAPPPAPAAPAVPAPPPASAPAGAEPDPTASFEAADLQRYRQLQQSIAKLQALQLPSKLATAQQFDANCRQQLLAAQGALPATRAALDREAKLAAKYAAGGGACLCFGNPDKKRAEADAQVARLQQQLAAQEQHAATAAAAAQEAAKQLQAWQAKGAELAGAQREAEALVQRMFAAPAWRASPRLNQLGDSLRALEAQAAEAGSHAASFGRGVQLLQGAARSLQEALGALGRTQALGAVNMGRGMAFQARTGVNARRQPGRQIGNLAEMAVFRRANEGVARAAAETAEASVLLGPGMPRVDPSILSSARRGMFANILVGGMVMDAIQLAAVRRSMEQVRQLLAQVQAALGWAQQNLGTAQQREAALRAQAASVGAEADAYRRQALAAAG